MKKLIIWIGTAILTAYFIFHMVANVLPEWAFEIAGRSFLQTEVKMSSVSLELTKNRATIYKLRISNPSGYQQPYAMKFKSLIASGVETKESVIIIQEVKVIEPEIFYELKSGTSNLEALQENIKKAIETLKGKETERKSVAEKSKFNIRKISISKAKVYVTLTSGQDKPFILDLPEIEMTNIGTDSGSDDLSSIIQKVIQKISSSVISLRLPSSEKIDSFIQKLMK